MSIGALETQDERAQYQIEQVIDVLARGGYSAQGEEDVQHVVARVVRELCALKMISHLRRGGHINDGYYRRLSDVRDSVSAEEGDKT